MNIVTLVILAAISLISCSTSSIKKDDRKIIEPKEFYKPISYLQYDCGYKKCGKNFTITSQIIENDSWTSEIKSQIQSIFDSTGVVVYKFNFLDKCQLISTDTISIENDKAIYGEFEILKNEIVKYEGEEKGKISCFDSPTYTLIWGNETQCKYAYSYCDEKERLIDLHKKYEQLVKSIENRKNTKNQE